MSGVMKVHASHNLRIGTSTKAATKTAKCDSARMRQQHRTGISLTIRIESSRLLFVPTGACRHRLSVSRVCPWPLRHPSQVLSNAKSPAAIHATRHDMYNQCPR